MNIMPAALNLPHDNKERDRKAEITDFGFFLSHHILPQILAGQCTGF